MVDMVFTRAKLRRFIKEYEYAVTHGERQFTFEGYPFLIGYAKYLIEFLDKQLEE